jgi:hypothetical protein
MCPDLGEFEEEGQLESLRQANVRLQRQLAAAKAKTTHLVEAVHLAAREAAVIVGAPKVVAPKPDKRTKGAEVALVHATDWQVGKRTVSYDSGVAAKRIELFASKVLRLTAIQRADHPVKHCTLLLGGDMVEGVAIFPGQPFEIDSSLYGQVFAAAAIIDTLVRTLASDFERVDVWTEYGNHGRLGRRGDHPGHDNIDLMLYRIVADRTKDLAHVEWHISTNWYQIVSIGNYRALLVHGDEFRSFGGNTPAFGIARKTNSWASGVVEDFHDVYIGHFHQSLVVPLARGEGRAFLTPSPESDNPYAKEFVAATGTPAQRLHFIDPERGRVGAEYLVYLD